jgi:hypothetical protein
MRNTAKRLRNQRFQGGRDGRRGAGAGAGAAWGAAVAFATLACTVTSVTAASANAPGATPGAAPAPSACGTPAVRLLDRLPSTGPATDTVTGIGAGSLTVGSTGNVPVYWTGTTVHRLPLPAGYTTGKVAAVNKLGLMAGTVSGPSGSRAFRYTAGAATSQLLDSGTYAAGVNDNGRITGGNTTTGKAYVWAGTHVERTLAVPAGRSRPTVAGIAKNGTVVGSAEAADADGNSGAVAAVWPAVASGATTTVTAHDLPPVVINNDTDTFATAVDEHGRIVGNLDYFHQDLGIGVYWDRPYTADHTQIGSLAGHEDKGLLSATSPTTGLIAGTAQFPEGIPPITPVDQPEIWTPGGPFRALPSLAADAPAGAESAGDNGSVGGWAYDADPYDGDGVRQPVVWTCAVQQAFVPTQRSSS